MSDRTVLFVTAEEFGRGDEALGAKLMSVMLDTLGDFGQRISHAIFVNGGAHLTVEGSPVLDQLRQLEQLGVQVLTCGTCLDYLGSADRLAVGKRSNMVEILETLTTAGRILRP